MTDDLTRRAFAAYFRSGGTDQPDGALSGEAEHNGLRYVVLVNTNGVLAVYRVIPRIINQRTTLDKATGAFVTDGGFGLALKRMKRWPKEIEEGLV